MVLSSPSGFTSGSAGGDLDLCSLGVAHGLSESGPREPVTNDGMGDGRLDLRIVAGNLARCGIEQHLMRPAGIGG